jgi:hypothetical protein
MQIINPTFGVVDDLSAEPRGAGNYGKRLEVYLLSNAKPNASELLAGIGQHLDRQFGRRPILVAKENPSVGAKETLLADIAAAARLAVVAIGD